jgi:hypothetical protein
MGEGLQTLALLFVQQPSIPPSVFASSKSRWSNAVKMLRYALSACAILALAPTVASAADFGPHGPGGYVEQRPLPPPPAYYPQPYYGRPYYDDAYYALASAVHTPTTWPIRTGAARALLTTALVGIGVGIGEAAVVVGRRYPEDAQASRHPHR